MQQCLLLHHQGQLDRFADPLVYTVGDNEWTDCHRPSNGPYNPLDRLAQIREVFFARTGVTLGQHSERVTSAARSGFPENVRFRHRDVSFAAMHIVGSNNSLAPWTGNTSPTPEQAAEVLGRTASVIERSVTPSPRLAATTTGPWCCSRRPTC